MRNYYLTLRGSSHKENQDAVYISEYCVCVCDGMSNTVHQGFGNGGVGAEMYSQALGSFLGSQECREYLKSAPINEIPSFVVDSARSIAESYKREYGEEDVCAFGSTFLSAVLLENEMLIIHAGDGGVFGLTKSDSENAVNILSYPDNNEGGVYPLTDDAQLKRMRVLKINTEEYSKILLCTDGFSNSIVQYKNKFFDSKLLYEAFKCSSREDLQRFVSKAQLNYGTTDDISCIMAELDAPGKGTDSPIPRPEIKCELSLKVKKGSTISRIITLVLILLTLFLSLLVYGLKNQISATRTRVDQLQEALDSLTAAAMTPDVQSSQKEENAQPVQEEPTENGQVSVFTQQSENTQTEESTQQGGFEQDSQAGIVAVQ